MKSQERMAVVLANYSKQKDNINFTQISEYLFFQFQHQLCTVMESVDESLMLICCAEAATQVENRIVIIQRQMS